MEEIIARKFGMLKSEWNERQRRLWAASEAMSLGHGGISIVSRATGLSRPTITRGVEELENNERLDGNRCRREGAGRKKATEMQPNLLPTLDALVEPTAKGDPAPLTNSVPLRWTTKSTRRLCDTLNEQGFEISFMQVGRLLHELEYQLSGNRKSIEGGTNPDRNAQFEFINEQSKEFLGPAVQASQASARMVSIRSRCSLASESGKRPSGATVSYRCGSTYASMADRRRRID